VTLIRSVADGLKVPVKGGGSTTFRRVDLDRGLEPDCCFYIANEKLVRTKTVINLSTDPPPDLCVEVEVSQRLPDRIGIYTALGVPELWRDNGMRLQGFRLDSDRNYVEAETSLAFPGLSANRCLNVGRGLPALRVSARLTHQRILRVKMGNLPRGRTTPAGPGRISRFGCANRPF
jgi:Uma2 family endonuclease